MKVGRRTNSSCRTNSLEPAFIGTLFGSSKGCEILHLQFVHWKGGRRWRRVSIVFWGLGWVGLGKARLLVAIVQRIFCSIDNATHSLLRKDTHTHTHIVKMNLGNAHHDPVYRKNCKSWLTPPPNKQGFNRALLYQRNQWLIRLTIAIKLAREVPLLLPTPPLKTVVPPRSMWQRKRPSHPATTCYSMRPPFGASS